MKKLLAGIRLLPLPCLAQDIKAYQNYDFVAGDKIIFAHDLANSHWKLVGSQAVVNKAGDEKAFFITKYYTLIMLRSKGNAESAG